jgi:hypothetical protein
MPGGAFLKVAAVGKPLAGLGAYVRKERVLRAGPERSFRE